MGKKLEVIIKKIDTKIGKRGEIIKVSQGYALNYLIPNQIAEIVTKGRLKHIQMIQNIENSKSESLYKNALVLKNNLNKIAKISIRKTIGAKQYIFGSINEKEIINQIWDHTGEKLEKKQITIPEIKQIGLYNINIQLFQDLQLSLKLQILPDHKIWEPR